MIILDTNVISEIIKKQPDEHVITPGLLRILVEA